MLLMGMANCDGVGMMRLGLGLEWNLYSYSNERKVYLEFLRWTYSTRQLVRASTVVTSLLPPYAPSSHSPPCPITTNRIQNHSHPCLRA